MAPSGGPSTTFGGGVPALAELTEDVVRSWNRTQIHAALFEYSLLDDARFDDDVEQLRGRLLAHSRAQAAAFQALAPQPTGAQAGAPSGVQAGALAPPVPPGRTGAPSPVTASRHRRPSTWGGSTRPSRSALGRTCALATASLRRRGATCKRRSRPRRTGPPATICSRHWTKRTRAARMPRTRALGRPGRTGPHAHGLRWASAMTQATKTLPPRSPWESRRAKCTARAFPNAASPTAVPSSIAAPAEDRARSPAPAPPMTSATDSSMVAPASATYSPLQVRPADERLRHPTIRPSCPRALELAQPPMMLGAPLPSRSVARTTRIRRSCPSASAICCAGCPSALRLPP